MAWPESLAGVPRPEPFEVAEILTLALLVPFVLAPPPIESLVARGLARWQFREGGWTRGLRMAKFPPDLARLTGRPAVELAAANETESFRERIRILRAAVFPGWRRRISLAGFSAVRQGLSEGHGVILWVNHCTESNVAAKQAMWRAGLPLAHLSRAGHPFSARPFGRRWLNPLFLRAEIPFLAERIVIEGDSTVAQLRRLRALLSANQVVSITLAGDATAFDEVPLLGGVLKVPRGPAQLAASTGASLLPVFTHPTAGGRTRVEIGSPLPVGQPRRATESTAVAMAAWLEARVIAHPAAWIGWRGRLFSPAPER
mgnify:CR=1 FL=1